MRPKYAIFLRLFDYIAAIVYGAGAALLVEIAVKPGWPAPLGMVAGMVLGVAAFVILTPFFILLIGGFEILMTGMFAGMVSGMGCAMLLSAFAGSAKEVLLYGAAFGLLVQISLHIYDVKHFGDVVLPERENDA